VEENEPVYIELADALELYAAIIGGTTRQAADQLRDQPGLEPARGALPVRHGKGGKRRQVGMDDWGWQQLDPWLKLRMELPVGALCPPLCAKWARSRRGARFSPPARSAHI